MIGLYEAEEAAAAKEMPKGGKDLPSLAQQVLALEPLGSRQHALSLLLNAAHILQVIKSYYNMFILPWHYRFQK